MNSDILFNFSQMISDSGSGYGAQLLEEMTASKPLFALDCGIKADDIWTRVETLKECFELIEDDDAKRIAGQMLYFSAGIMPDLDAVENRYEYIETLEDTITSFKDSGDDFAEKLVAMWNMKAASMIFLTTPLSLMKKIFLPCSLLWEKSLICR